MFGYVRPLRAELKVKTLEQYQASYCGLCRMLGKEFGFVARFTVSYDLVFLYLLLDGMSPQAPRERCRCPAKPWRKKSCICQGQALRQAAALNIILAYWKLEDAIHDERGVRRRAAHLGKWCLRHAYRKAAAENETMANLVPKQLRRLSRLEAEKNPCMDCYADAFAQILCRMADLFPQPEYARPAQELLYHVGRYLYLTDALDDLEKDLKNDSANPLVYRFSVDCAGLRQEDKQYLISSIDRSLDLAAAALELLPLRGSDEILHNIIYLGLPAVLKSVADGTFHKNQTVRSKL